MALTRPIEIVKPFADDGSKNTIPIPTQVSTDPGAASFETGFPPATMLDISLGGIAPDGMDMNGIFYSITEHIRFMNAGGQPVFDTDLAAEIGGYPVGVILQDNAGVNSYINILANNTTNFNTTPASIGVSWIFYNSIYSAVPTGACMYFPATTAPPGWLKRNGALLSRTTYAKLWAFAQTSGNIVADASWQEGMFSTGDGTTTFRIPDGRGEFVRGWDDSRGVDSGRAIGTSQTASSTLTGGINTQSDGGYSRPVVEIIDGDSTTTVAGNRFLVSEAISTLETYNYTRKTFRPRNVALLACIKY